MRASEGRVRMPSHDGPQHALDKLPRRFDRIATNRRFLPPVTATSRPVAEPNQLQRDRIHHSFSIFSRILLSLITLPQRSNSSRI